MKRLLTVIFVPAATLLFAAAHLYGQGRADQWLVKPVDQKTFEGFLDFFVYDTAVALDPVWTDVVEREGIRREHVSFVSTPGVRVTAYYYRAAIANSERRPTVIVLHGGVPRGKDATGPASLQMVRAGLNVLAIDMLYFGERKTELMTLFTEQEKHEKLYNQQALMLSWVAQTVKDVGRSFDLLVQVRGADPRRIGLVGFSRGGQVGIIVAAAEKRLAAALLTITGHFDRFETGHRAAACPANYIGRIAPRPLYVINGDFDSDYDKQTSVLPLHKHARKPFTSVWVPTGHQAPAPDVMAPALDWMRVTLTR